MKQSLQLKVSQQLTLTPQLQQSIRLLQLSTLELNQEIEAMLQDNPLLEREESGLEDEAAPQRLEAPGAAERGEARDEADAPPPDEAPADTVDTGDDGWWEASGAPRDPDDDEDWNPAPAGEVSLREHLAAQLALLPLSTRDRSLVTLLIDALNDDGYLETSLEELAEALPAELEVEPIELATALRHLQNMEPAGVGARNVAECLALQLEALEPQTRHRDLALRLARAHLELLAARDFARLKKLLGCDDDALRGAQQLIRSLNPRPGAAYGASDVRYVVPDVVVRQVRGRWTASLNAAAMPKLRINALYADLLHRNRDSGNLSGQLQEARWLIKNIQQRFETILRVSSAIVERQKAFFDHGEVGMRPLVLREIADELGLHESTISRVTTQKYMMTPRGIFELKYFFGSHVSTDTGGAASATAIRALIRQLIGAEEPKKPLSDGQLAEILAQQGINVARRTVAKYRESMQIPTASLRKSL